MDVEKNIAHGRKYGLDFLKGLAACFVVFMHVKFPDMVGYYVSILGRSAVPIFFMTSGYFALGASKSKTLKSIKRTLSYILVAYVLSLVYWLLSFVLDSGYVIEHFSQRIFTVDHFLRFVFLTDTRVCGVAWFLLSLLICYSLKYFLGEQLRYIAYIGILIRIVGAIQYPFLGLTIPVNTPWITGIPFFVLGELIHENESFLQTKIPKNKCLLTGGMGLFILMFPVFHGSLLWFIGTLLLSPSLFVLFSRLDMDYNRFCLFGSTYAFFIYIVHPLVMHACDAVQPSPSTAGMWLRPVIVLAITVLLAVLYYSAKSIVNRYKIKTV